MPKTVKSSKDRLRDILYRISEGDRSPEEIVKSIGDIVPSTVKSYIYTLSRVHSRIQFEEGEIRTNEPWKLKKFVFSEEERLQIVFGLVGTIDPATGKHYGLRTLGGKIGYSHAGVSKIFRKPFG